VNSFIIGTAVIITTNRKVKSFLLRERTVARGSTYCSQVELLQAGTGAGPVRYSAHLTVHFTAAGASAAWWKRNQQRRVRLDLRQGSCHMCTGRIREIVGRQVETLRSQFFACIQKTLRE
jgi:hypothetical protein